MSTSIANKTQYWKTIRKTCYGANIIYLIAHIFYLILSIISKTYVMIYVNAAVIVLYALYFLVIRSKKYYIYALICGNTFLAFVTVATLMLGFNTGFHFYLIGLCVVSFFTTYFSKDRNIKGSIFWVGLSLAIYLTLYFISQYNAPYYAIEKWLERLLFTIHATAVFAFVAIYLLIFLKYAFSLEKKITNESRTDELTQIANRYALYDYFDQEVDKSSQLLALFDIDDFKNINDMHGHVTGDFILKAVAERATKVLDDAFVCRYGGEEFIAVLTNNNEETFFARLEALRKSVESDTFEFEGVKMKITLTIGASNYVEGISLDKWIELADTKMYLGKNSGKNKTIV